VAVRIRLKRMGRTHRPFYRVCATDKHTPRDGRVLEELGTYDTSVLDTDARAVLNKERVDYWLSVGAQPSDKVAVLIKKYGTSGTHVDAQNVALEKLGQPKMVPEAGAPASLPKKEEPKQEEAPVAEKTEEAAVEGKVEGKPKEKTGEKTEAKVEEKKEEKTEAPAEQASKEEAGKESKEETGKEEASKEA